VIRLTVPTLRYNYVHIDASGAPVVPAGFQPDQLTFDMLGSPAVGTEVEAQLLLRTRSSPRSQPVLGETGLSHVRVFTTVAECDFGKLGVTPEEFGSTREVIDQTALFRQPRARVGKSYLYSVKVTPTASGTLRLVYGLQASELLGVVLIGHDLVVP